MTIPDVDLHRRTVGFMHDLETVSRGVDLRLSVYDNVGLITGLTFINCQYSHAI